MKFTCAVKINLPVEKVARLFDDKNNLKDWQEGFVSSESISGKPGEVGAKSKIIYNRFEDSDCVIFPLSSRSLLSHFQ